MPDREQVAGVHLLYPALVRTTDLTHAEVRERMGRMGAEFTRDGASRDPRVLDERLTAARIRRCEFQVSALDDDRYPEPPSRGRTL